MNFRTPPYAAEKEQRDWLGDLEAEMRLQALVGEFNALKRADDAARIAAGYKPLFSEGC